MLLFERILRTTLRLKHCHKIYFWKRDHLECNFLFMGSQSFKTSKFVLYIVFLCIAIACNLHHMCQTQACGPNLARNEITIGSRDHIKGALELPRGLCYVFYFKLKFSLVWHINILLFQILCLSKIKICFHIERLNTIYQLLLIFQ